MLLNVRVIADGPFDETFTPENLAKTYGGRMHRLTQLIAAGERTRVRRGGRGARVSDLLRDLIFDYTLRNVALGSALLGIVSGVLGSFAVLRRQGLLGDTLAHAALPGICVAFLLTGSREQIVLLLGAGIAGWIGTMLLLAIVRRTDPQ